MSTNSEPEPKTAEMLKAELEQKDFELKLAEIKLERVKAWLTAASIILPLLATLTTFYFTNRYTRENLEREHELSHINSKKELLKLLIENPDRKQEIIQMWRAVFPADEWSDNIGLSSTPESNNRLQPSPR